LIDFIQNGLRTNDNDSPIHEALDVRIDDVPKKINRQEILKYKLSKNPKKIINLITGDIQNVNNIDIWVNSENTNMQMARYFDRSVSGIIRYLGAKKDLTGNVTQDIIAQKLSEIMGVHTTVPATAIIVTESGELADSHNVKKIFHAAAVQGSIADGYRPIPNISRCITEALKKADSLKESTSEENLKLKSILFPIMGTGTAKGDLRKSAQELIKTAIYYLEDHPDSTIDEVYFLSWIDKEFDMCTNILDEIKEVAPVKLA